MSSKRITLIFPWIVISGTLYWLSSIPSLVPPDLGFSWQDKLYHMVAFFVYGCCTTIAVLSIWRRSTTMFQRLIILMFGILFAISDELHQMYVPNRFAGIDDVVADGIGVCLSLFAFSVLSRYVSRFLFTSRRPHT